MMVNDLYESRKNTIRHLVLNARGLPHHLAFDLALETGSSVGNATSLTLLRHSLAFTSIRRAGQHTSAVAMGLCAGGVLPVDFQWVLQWLPCQVRGVRGSVLGPLGPVSVYCDWVRQQVLSAACLSVWQHIQLSKGIHPWDTSYTCMLLGSSGIHPWNTLACCWDLQASSGQQHCVVRTEVDENGWCRNAYINPLAFGFVFFFMLRRERKRDWIMWMAA